METPMTRAEQARAEAERRFPLHGEDIGDAYGYDYFMDGAKFSVEWVDANPAPRTVTLDELSEAMHMYAQGDMDLDDLVGVLEALGIEVEDDSA